jgi:hypothetical protein
MSNRHNKFLEIRGLDSEFDFFDKRLEEVGGKIITELPSVKNVKDFTRYFLRVDKGFHEYIVLDGKPRKVSEII